MLVSALWLAPVSQAASPERGASLLPLAALPFLAPEPRDVDPEVPSVPALSPWALGLLAVLLLGTSWVMLRTGGGERPAHSQTRS